MTVTDTGGVRVHGYTAPDSSINVTTHVIETPNLLVGVDGQLTVVDADDVVEYAARLGKPWEKLITSHEHPDHFQGAARFGAPIHALPIVRDQWRRAGICGT
ncbi:hypothetical protein [Rathayibacter sp. SD072]|uniref:hypothetical protein n=1 Tax=Rathayibacter sp. SD072 TaxID=2781731 RepID=UPI001A95EA61|nr:hypothetical protein [Rathayibacter sp. SD072]